MKCTHCGADIKRGQTICEYCGCEVERDNGLKVDIVDIPFGEQDDNTINYKESSSSGKTTNNVKTIGSILVKIVFIITAGLILMVFIALIGLTNSDFFSRNHDSIESHSTKGSLPKNMEGLYGTVKEYNRDGNISLIYGKTTYDNVKIINTELINWLNETNRSLKGAAILFDTDSAGNIAGIAMNSEEFFILSKENNSYTALRGKQLIKFTSEIALDTDGIYTGYFSYPVLKLVSAKQVFLSPMIFMDPKCSKKQKTEEKEAYTGEKITVYKILAEGQWYYCNKNTYNLIRKDSSLSDFKFYNGPYCAAAP